MRLRLCLPVIFGLTALNLAAQPAAAYVSTYIGNMKFVPAGSFQRNSAVTNISSVSAFRISEYEITRSQYVAVTGLTDPSNKTVSMTNSDPVQQVNWYDAIVFCNRLSLLENLEPVYSIGGSTDPNTWGVVPAINNLLWNAVKADWSANGYRLPTEMEWRWAAMGADTEKPGEVNTTGYLKPFAGSSLGGSLDDFAWYEVNSNRRTNPAGFKKANELGLYDMSGNVWEWCWDWYGNYPTGLVQDYRGPASGEYRVLAGGCWSMKAMHCAVGFRYFYDPHYRLVNYGFRVVRR